MKRKEQQGNRDQGRIIERTDLNGQAIYERAVPSSGGKDSEKSSHSLDI